VAISTGVGIEILANLGCLVAMILPLVGLIFFWLFLFLGVLFR
jgi:hypothetical protein